MSTEVTLGNTKLSFIESAGNLFQNVGIPRTTGQIYGLLYLSPRALSLDDISGQLSISKASASGGSRQLLGWQAIRHVWIPGERRDFFEVRGELGDVVKAVYENVFRVKIEKSSRKIKDLMITLEAERNSGVLNEEAFKHCQSRLHQLEKIQGRLNVALPLLEKLI